MHFYIPKPLANSYDNLSISASEDIKWFIEYRRQYYLNNISSHWRSISTEVIQMGKSGDFPSFVGLNLVFSERVWNYLEDIIIGSVEALPIETSAGECFFYIKVLEKLDCLDYSKSIWRKNPSGLIMVNSYVFQEDLIKDKNIFWLPCNNQFFVSNLFKERVEKLSLEGLYFEQLE
jgi:hypothetical protein